MSYTFNLKISDMTFCVTSLYPSTAYYCQKFLIKETGEHRIVITQEHIDNERERFRNSDSVDPELAEASDNFLETVTLLRVLADYVTMYDRLLMHGSAISINGKGYIFTALSGTGKSTHTALLRELHSENAIMINDDKPFLHILDKEVYVCGSPWMGKHGLGNNIQAQLGGIFFLRRSETNELRRISPEEALCLLVGQCHRPAEPIRMMNTLDMLEKILNNVPLYDFGCNMDISAAELSSSVMK